MRHSFDIDIENSPARESDGLGVHQIAFEERLDPGAIFRHSDDDAGGISDRCKMIFVGA